MLNKENYLDTCKVSTPTASPNGIVELKMEDIKKKSQQTINSNNRFITKEEVQKILLKGNIEVEINDLKIWQRAFIHKSYLLKTEENEVISPTFKGMVPLQEQSNERLEWLGDANLQSTISGYLFNRYPDMDEGFLTKLRSKLVKTESLSYLANKLNLSPYLIISYQVEFSSGGRSNNNILENTFEAFLGAMYLDFTNKKNEAYGYEVVRRFITQVVERYVDIAELIMKDDNYKDQLMWYFQKKYNGSFPIYEKDKIENDHFFMIVKDPELKKIVGRGSARSKKKAEQLCAKNALQFYAQKDNIIK